MKRFFYKILEKIGLYCNNKCLKYIYFNKKKSNYLYERVIEFAFTLEKLSENKILNVLDVGTGTNSFSSTLEHCGFNVTASDLMGSYWSFFQNRHIFVYKDDITKSKFESEKFDAVTCISTLEHIEDYNAAIKQMVRIIKSKGLLILTFPYSCDEFCENVYKLKTADKMAQGFRYIARSFCDDQIEEWCSRFNIEIADKKYIRGWDGKFWRSGKRIDFPYEVKEKEKANAICLVFKKRM
ncbi:class I SAM-dependent methyltransferase [bacterium]|jgi:2-polyprenyl-3-methyl-5-hydroxy-6-metoxy-1,4-benzoquinol methylase|nr:class I SAM-dependent methyltransferase [bacterium]MBT3581950.1 class I SAM-dependent methyltransferase [bacterium]MBT4551697.1 class I SAM-dependent methyltransferase [bacterium]